jgi:hypothetical protein
MRYHNATLLGTFHLKSSRPFSHKLIRVGMRFLIIDGKSGCEVITDHKDPVGKRLYPNCGILCNIFSLFYELTFRAYTY